MASDFTVIVDDDDTIVVQDTNNNVNIYEGVAPNAGGDHSHDATYYTEEEVNGLLADKANSLDISTAISAIDYPVDSVNGKTDAVTLNADDIDDTATINKFVSATDIAKIDSVESGAEANNITDTNATDLTDGTDSVLHFHAADRNRVNHVGVQEIGTIAGLQTALDGKQATGDYATNAALTNGLATKSATTHLHDDRYYTETETNTLLSGKSDTSHAHAVNDLSDVMITTPASGQVIKYNGSAWINDTDAAGSADHGTLTGLADDDHTQYHNDTRGDARYYVKATVDSYLASKQATLVSGTNIKTINGSSMLGSGNITVTGGIANIVEDTTPQLGGDLDTNSKKLKLGNVTLEAGSSNVNFGVNGVLMTNPANAAGQTELLTTGSMLFTSNTGGDGMGMWEPYFFLETSGRTLFGNNNQGLPADRYAEFKQTAGVKVTSNDKTVGAFVKADNVTVDRTLQTPDADGTIATREYIAVNAKGYVNHGATASTARPTGYASIEWIGSVEPTNATTADTWIDTSGV